MDTHRILPTQALVREMAKILLAECVQDALTIPPKIGQHWVYRFIKQHPKLKLFYNRKYNYQRAKCKDPKVIRS